MKLWLLNGYLFHKFSSNKLLTFSIKQVLKFSPCISSIKFVLSVYFIHKVCFYCCCYLSCEFIYLSAFWIIYLLIRWPIPKKMFSFFSICSSISWNEILAVELFTIHLKITILSVLPLLISHLWIASIISPSWSVYHVFSHTMFYNKTCQENIVPTIN